MHVLVIGSGGREHALTWKLAQSPRVTRLSVAPGNGGTSLLADNVEVDATDVVGLVAFAQDTGVDLVVIGPEEPLEMGLVDQLAAIGITTFGPCRDAALIETSKSFAKQLMVEQGAPTAPYEVFTSLDDACDYVLSHPVEDYVIKADGLARGKGVFLPAGESDAEGILRALLQRDALGAAGRRVIIEQRLVGDELSVMAFTDGKSVAMMPAVRDHKPLYDGGKGPNTGGMGAYAPAPGLTPKQVEEVRCRIIEPVLKGLRGVSQSPFVGVVYVGVVLTAEGPMALELNARLGDPGAQVVLPLLETDLLDVIEACVLGRLHMLDIQWRENAAAATVVLTSPGYPYHSDPSVPIVQTRDLPEGVVLFHAGTRFYPGRGMFTAGGRVLDVTGMGSNLLEAVRLAYDGVEYVRFEGAHYRTDIGASLA